MINLPKCDSCVHNEICKIRDKSIKLKEKLIDNKIDEEIPIGTDLELKCTYYKHELQDWIC